MIENLLAVAPPRTQASFYRTAVGAEVDLLLELPGGREPWAIEIKRTLAPRVEKGFHSARADLVPARSWVLYPGADRSLAAGVEAIGFTAALTELAATALAQGAS
nr:DUF4143 domain-containing protein [uncultured Thiodictyon sp.]